MKEVQMKFIVYEYPWKDREFERLQDAINYILKHKSGVRDCCWVEDEQGNVVYHGTN